MERDPPLVTQPPSAQRDRAGFWLRLIAFAIDLWVLSMFALLLLFIGLLASNLGADLNGLDFPPFFPFALPSRRTDRYSRVLYDPSRPGGTNDRQEPAGA